MTLRQLLLSLPPRSEWWCAVRPQGRNRFERHPAVSQPRRVPRATCRARCHFETATVQTVHFGAGACPCASFCEEAFFPPRARCRRWRRPPARRQRERYLPTTTVPSVFRRSEVGRRAMLPRSEVGRRALFCSRAALLQLELLFCSSSSGASGARLAPRKCSPVRVKSTRLGVDFAVRVTSSLAKSTESSLREGLSSTRRLRQSHGRTGDGRVLRREGALGATSQPVISFSPVPAACVPRVPNRHVDQVARLRHCLGFGQF